MDSLTARPQNIIGNVAVASLWAGLPVGGAVAVFAGLSLPARHSMLEWAKDIGSGLLFGPVLVFLAGLVVVAPVLALLRRLGYGGPLSVYAISFAFALSCMCSDVRFGLLTLVFSLPASLVFCRYSYASTMN